MRAVFLALAFLVVATPAFSESKMIMFNSPICEWCEIWEEEVGVVYGKTDIGQKLPVRRVDISDDRPSDLQHLKGIRFTPTFVVLENGREIGRILGYPGESFFWGLLEKLAKKLGKSVAACDTQKLVTANATPAVARGMATC
jgi:thioredoxin-related protein